MLDALFLFSAAVGGLTIVLRMPLMLFGIGHGFDGGHDFGSGAGHDVGLGSAHEIGPGDAQDVETGDGADAHGDADAGTRLFTLQGVASFLMMFGLVGLALTRQAHLPPTLAAPIALGAGLASMWMLARVFAAMLQLQSSGTIDLRHAIGHEGTVYLTIKPGSGGQVQVDIQGRLGVYEAQSSGGELATGRAIRVVDVRGSTLVVEALPNL